MPKIHYQTFQWCFDGARKGSGSFFLVHMHIDLVDNGNVAVHHVARERRVLCHGFTAFQTDRGRTRGDTDAEICAVTQIKCLLFLVVFESSVRYFPGINSFVVCSPSLLVDRCIPGMIFWKICPHKFIPTSCKA